MSLHRLLPLFERARALDQPLVLATVIRTGGSTYAKPGAQMLIAADGEYAGLLSGGCLEGDLREHARAVAASGNGRIVSYDMRSTTDQLFGLGAGCEGAMDVLLTRVSAHEHWQPLQSMAEAAGRGAPHRVAFITSSHGTALPLGALVSDATAPANGSEVDADILALRQAANASAGNTLIRVAQPDVELFIAALAPSPHLLLLGGGPDARPVAVLAAFLGWRVTVVDHRPAYLDAARFPANTRLVETPAAEIAEAVTLDDYSAAIVMSHHLESDLQYLRALAASAVPYVGLLGPAARREKLLGDLGEPAPLLRARLRAPVGLDIGGREPESIALSIIGEVHVLLAGRGGRPFSETAN
ncbi:MAG TPA: XdhC family protein [Steroidobacteraceae bacterium]|nr:XdhC family protein [Steroidobacteraceae bacterium]